MSPEACFDPLELSEIACGDFPEERRPRVESHVAACEECRGKLFGIWEELPGLGESRMAKRRFHWVPAAAAAAVLAAAGLSLLPFFSAAAGRTGGRGENAGTAVQGLSEELESQARSPSRYRLPDGTQLLLEKGGFARFHPPAEGERVRLELVRGTLEAQVAPGKGAFLISAPAGEIRVVGTRFRARTFQMVSPVSNAITDAHPSILEGLCVDMHEGKVVLKNGFGEFPLTAPQRGLALSTRTPLPLERGGSRKAVVAQCASLLVKDGGAYRIPAGLEGKVEYLAALFWGPEWDEAADGLEALRRNASEPELGALGILERMGVQ